MTDAKLRQLERRWKESGAVEDEAAYLLERVRVGDLEQEKLELAAYCGHAGAGLALGDEAPSLPEDLQGWSCGLSTEPVELGLRAVIAALDWALPFVGTQLTPEEHTALAEAQAWLADPTEDRRDLLRALSRGDTDSTAVTEPVDAIRRAVRTPAAMVAAQTSRLLPWGLGCIAFATTGLVEDAEAHVLAASQSALRKWILAGKL